MELARTIIVSCRRRLEWLLLLPEWEPLLEEGTTALELPGRRQGIGFRAAVEALALEHKFTLLRWVVPRHRRLFQSRWVQRVASDWGLPVLEHEHLDAYLSATQWDDFSGALSQALAREQRRYKQAQATLFHAHRGLVRSVAARIVFASSRRADAEQEGNLALLSAIDRIDDLGAGFESYAQHWIARGVRNHLLRERLPVYAPVNLVSRALRGGDGLPAGMLEPRVELDSIPEGREPADSDSDEARAAADRAAARELVRGCLGRLTQKQREVVELRYGIQEGCTPMTIQEIARRIGITHQQVSMREKRALAALADMLAPLADELRA